MTKRTALWVAAIVGAAAVLAALVMASGLRFYTVMTPSMGRTAPVGTLVVTRPSATYQVGEIVTYERDGRSYTHRIITANPDGTFVTKGDLNGAADPLPVTMSEVVGRAVWLAPGLGWLWRGLPWLMLGFLIVYALSLTRRLDATWRWVTRISGWTLVFCLVAVWLRPWVSLDMLAWVPTDGGGVDMHVVNTGLFPLDVLSNRLVSGQDAVVHVTQQNDRGAYTLTPGLAFHWWEQLGLLLLCLIPLGLSMLIRDERTHGPARAIPNPENGSDEPAAHADQASGAALEAERPRGRHRLILVGATIVAIIVSVAVVTFTTTSAALTAKVANSTNTAATRTYFTCAKAVGSTANPVPYLSWALGTAQSTSTDEADLSGNGRYGRYLVTSTVNSSIGCLRDKPAASVVFDGSSQCLYENANYTATAPSTFSVEAWFMTSTTALNGKIIGLGSSRNTSSDTTYDRHIYLDKDGRVVFGIYDNAQKIVASPAGTTYNDGKWHHVVGTFSPSTGMALYLDGNLVASATQTSINSDTGYWKVGCGTLSTWADAAGSTTVSKPAYFKGQIQYAAVYTVVLTAAQVKDHYLAGVS